MIPSLENHNGNHSMKKSIISGVTLTSLLALTEVLFFFGSYCFSWQYLNLRQRTSLTKPYFKYYKMYAEDRLIEAMLLIILSNSPTKWVVFWRISKYLLALKINVPTFQDVPILQRDLSSLTVLL